MSAETVIKDFLHVIRTQFYTDNVEKFWPEQAFLKRSLTYPASYLRKRGVELEEAKYRAILEEIIQGIKRYGDTSKIKFFSWYFLDCVQRHMGHHGDRYYEEGKALRNILEKNVDQLTKKQAQRLQEGGSPIVDTLAELHKLVKSPGKRKVTKQPDQLSLL